MYRKLGQPNEEKIPGSWPCLGEEILMLHGTFGFSLEVAKLMITDVSCSRFPFDRYDSQKRRHPHIKSWWTMMKIIKVRQFMPRGPVVVTNYKLPLTPFVTRHENNELIQVFIYQCAKARNNTFQFFLSILFYDSSTNIFFFNVRCGHYIIVRRSDRPTFIRLIP